MAIKNPLARLARKLRGGPSEPESPVPFDRRLGFALAEDIAHLDPEAWREATIASSLFIRRPYLDALHETAPPALKPRCALIYRGRRAVAAVAAQSIVFEPGKMMRKDAGVKLERKRDRLARAIVTKSFDARPTPVLLCGNLYSWGLHGVGFAPDEEASALWPAVAHALERMAAADRLAPTTLTLVKDIPDSRAGELAALEADGFQSMDLEPDMVLAIPEPWRTHVDYTKSLNAKYRKSVAGLFKDIEAAGLLVERLPDLSHEAERLYELYMQVWSKAPVRGPAIAPDYLPRLAAVLGEDFRCTVIRRAERIVGFVTTLKDADTAVGYIVGVDYEENAQAPVYLRLLHATLEEAIAYGCRSLTLGPTALEPKARLGAKAVPGRALVKHSHGAMNLLLAQLLPHVPVEEPPDRNPFK